MNFETSKLSSILEVPVVIGTNKMGYPVVQLVNDELTLAPTNTHSKDYSVDVNLKSLKFTTFSSDVIHERYEYVVFDFKQDKLLFVDELLYVPVYLFDVRGKLHKVYVELEDMEIYNLINIDNPYIKVAIIKDMTEDEYIDEYLDTDVSYVEFKVGNYTILISIPRDRSNVDGMNHEYIDIYMRSILDTILIAGHDTEISSSGKWEVDKDSPVLIDWEEASELGLLELINTELLHPLGLAVTRKSDVSLGLLISPDLKWEYSENRRSTLISKIELKEKLIERLNRGD